MIINTRESYLPQTVADQDNWLFTFSSKLPTFAVDLGLTPAQLGSVANDYAFFHWVVLMVLAFTKNIHERVQFREHLASGKAPLGPLPADPGLPVVPPAVEAGIFTRIQLLVRTIKANANYTEAMGKSLGIVGAEVTIDTQFIAPVLHSSIHTGHPHLKYAKDHMEGIHVYADYDGNGFNYVGTTTHATFIDGHPLPAAGVSVVWKYRAVFIYNEKEEGNFSADLAVRVTGI